MCPQKKDLESRVYIHNEHQWVSYFHGLENHIHVSFTTYRYSFHWECFLFLNPGYHAGDARSACDLVRSKTSWGMKGSTVPPKVSPHNPMSNGTVADSQALKWSCVSCSWPDFSEQVWDSQLDQVLVAYSQGRTQGLQQTVCFLHSVCSSD